MSEKTGQKPTSPSRIGDLAEHYAITYLWDKGYHVFKNCGCTGPIDIKSYKDGRLSSRTTLQKELGVQYLHYNSKTRKLRFINHRINNE